MEPTGQSYLPPEDAVQRLWRNSLGEAWAEGESEPSWQSVTTAPYFDPPSGDELAIEISDNASGNPDDLGEYDRLITWKIHYLHDNVGSGTDPCFGPTPPAPDPPSGRGCLAPTALASPPDASYQYFDVGGTYQPRSSELTLVTSGVGGLFLRPGIDYVEIYSAGWIGVDNSIDLTGKSLWFCAYFEPILISLA